MALAILFDTKAVIGVCDSGQESSIKNLLHELRDLSSRSGGEVRFIQLPYSDLDSFELARGTVDGIILCHSIHNRRFSITDVDDALYDKFLPCMAETYGKNNVAVIVYDFPWHTHRGSEERSSIHHVRMATFRIKQPTTFECSKLAITCGRLDTTLEIDIEDRENLAVFVQNVQPRRRLSLLKVLLILGGAGALIHAALKLKTFVEKIVPALSRLINTAGLLYNTSSLLDQGGAPPSQDYDVPFAFSARRDPKKLHLAFPDGREQLTFSRHHF
ncbi:uncharacterized protein [Diadema antillarum]|uniref:uncharacterized protein n=1 Tax=Diadema antillarum TaxID=105358 RepID=UPI003A84F0A5